MEIINEQNQVVLKNISDFNLKHIFECGQCFRWIKEDDNCYIGVAFNKIVKIEQKGDEVTFYNTTIVDFENIWRDYFDLNRDYSAIKKSLAKIDDDLKNAIKFGDGIRILNQDVFEMIITFIISANNRIPMIMRAVEGLSQKYGEHIGTFEGKDYYSFPKPEKLADAEVSELRVSGVGFRDKYISQAAKYISENMHLLNDLKSMEYKDAIKELQKLPGVGPKVADCISLFSLEKSMAFPVDTWVKKVMEHFYLPTDSTFKKIKEYADNVYGEYAGFAQQYLFYYARENKIG